MSDQQQQQPKLTILDIVARAIVVYQLIIQQVQYIALFNQLDIKWPDGFRSGYSDLEIVNINLRQYIGAINIPVINFRGLFTIISVMIPIAITLLVLVLFQPFIVVILYAVLTFGSVVLIAGLLGKYISQSVGDIGIDSGTAESYVIAGAVMTGAALLFLIIYKGILHKELVPKGVKIRGGSGSDAALRNTIQALEERDAHYRKFHRTRTFRHMMSTMFLVMVGLTLTGLLDFGIEDILASSNISIWKYVGYVFLVVGMLNFVYFFMCLFSIGRAIQLKLAYLLNRNGLMILLVGLSSMYIPVLTYALGMLMCKRYECPSGTVFNPYGDRPAGSWSTSPDIYCDPCTVVNPGTCSTGGLCAAYSSRRSWQFPETSCDDQASTMFRIAAGIATAAFGLSIPAMFYFVTRYLTTRIGKHDFKFRGYGDIRNRDERWSVVTSMVRPVASSLYEAYKEDAAQFQIINMFERVLIMLALVVLAPFYVEVATPAMFVVYLLYFFILLYYKPYLHGMEKGLALGLGVANVLNGIVALVVWKEDIQSFSPLFSIYIAFNVAIPVIAALIGHKMNPQLKTITSFELKEKDEDANDQFVKVLDKQTGEKYLSRFFMTTGVLFVIAFGACIVGMLGTPDDQYLISTNALYQTNEIVLGGYKDWNTMVSTCCCIQSQTPPAGWKVSERWLCPNGKVIERGRTRYDGATSIPLRSVCAKTPTQSSCSILTDAYGVPTMNCPDSVYNAFVPSQVSEVAYAYYF